MEATYVIVCWPESQELMDKEGFEEYSYPITDERGLNDFGSGAYFVDKKWLQYQNKMKR
ncbi:MAG: hypothetical protein LIP09_12260 [Bacteroidales bacterium]|nr:hypothetical protein [Bacteroidales bacterium]